jgi:hypothetical protein
VPAKVKNATLAILAEDDINDGDTICTNPEPDMMADAINTITYTDGS